jgi:mRNA-degrading endonuclease RelE of RelBE toxin-antitoxin system
MATVEQEVINELKKLDAEHQQLVLAYVRSLAVPSVMYTARELIKLPPIERERLVSEAFKAAEGEDFEAIHA